MTTADPGPCLLCGGGGLSMVYEPEGSLRHAAVFVCDRCGLLQSRYRVFREDRVIWTTEARGDGVVRPSCLADYGNLRTGKLGRETDAIEAVADHFGDDVPRRILDVGGSRGWLVKAALARWPDCRATLLEPDGNVIPDRAFFGDDSRRVEIVRSRLGDWPGGGTFDVVFMVHTLEHLSDPVEQLRRLGKMLVLRGILWTEVPNVPVMMLTPDMVEEVFIDKHVCHFSSMTLRAAVHQAGFSISRSSFTDGESLRVLAQPSDEAWPSFLPVENEMAREEVKVYERRRAANWKKIKGWAIGAAKIFTNRRAVAWGAGRLLDALQWAGLDLALFEAVVDSYSPLEEFHGLPVVRPELLKEIRPEVVLVCSRSSAGEIKIEALQSCPEASIICWSDLIEKGEHDHGGN